MCGSRSLSQWKPQPLQGFHYSGHQKPSPMFIYSWATLMLLISACYSGLKGLTRCSRGCGCSSPGHLMQAGPDNTAELSQGHPLSSREIWYTRAWGRGRWGVGQASTLPSQPVSVLINFPLSESLCYKVLFPLFIVAAGFDT